MKSQYRIQPANKISLIILMKKDAELYVDTISALLGIKQPRNSHFTCSDTVSNSVLHLSVFFLWLIKYGHVNRIRIALVKTFCVSELIVLLH